MPKFINAFSWEGLLTLLRGLQRREAQQSKEMFRQIQPTERIPYIEMMLPVTGVIAPIGSFAGEPRTRATRRR